MTSSVEPPPYLASLQNNIRARPIPWDGAVRAGNLADEQLKKIKTVDKVRKEQRKQNIEGDLLGYSTLLVGGKNGPSVLEKAAKRTDIIQYVLVLAADLINGMPLAKLGCGSELMMLTPHRFTFPSLHAP
jgi:V-type H+-transporting ATPase subunit H